VLSGSILRPSLAQLRADGQPRPVPRAREVLALPLLKSIENFVLLVSRNAIRVGDGIFQPVTRVLGFRVCARRIALLWPRARPLARTVTPALVGKFL